MEPNSLGGYTFELNEVDEAIDLFEEVGAFHVAEVLEDGSLAFNENIYFTLEKLHQAVIEETQLNEAHREAARLLLASAARELPPDPPWSNYPSLPFGVLLSPYRQSEKPKKSVSQI